MKIKIIAGTAVQIISIIWPSNNLRFVREFTTKVIKRYATNAVIMVKISMVWS
jgi:hypothetical protein